ncbi:MAG: CrcB family protein [Balneolaceae bacterium]|nr:CrcB family protein [Balneolaceae bacterium]
MVQLFFVAAGGAAGAIIRYILSLFISRLTNHSQVVTGTAVANAVGSFLAGLVMGYLTTHPAESADFGLFFSVGFLGSLTTFSTFVLEFRNLLDKSFSHQAIYLLLQMGGSLLLALIGILAGSVLAGGFHA